MSDAAGADALRVAELMDQIWPLATAVMAANGLTMLFGFGLWRLRQNEDFNVPTALCLFMPLLFFAGGMLIYG